MTRMTLQLQQAVPRRLIQWPRLRLALVLLIRIHRLLGETTWTPLTSCPEKGKSRTSAP